MCNKFFRLCINTIKYLNFNRKNIDDNSDFENAVKRLTNNENDTVRPRTLIIMQRNLTFQRVCGQVLDATFEELCDRVRLLFNIHIIS